MRNVMKGKAGRYLGLSALTAFVCLTVLAGCGNKDVNGFAGEDTGSVFADAGENTDARTDTDAGPADGQVGEPASGGADGESAETKTLRIVDGAESGILTLAGEGAGDVYTLAVGEIPVYLDGKEADAAALEDGMMAEISYGGDIMETFPAQLGNVYSISVYSRGSQKNPGGSLYDLCGLYLQVLSDLWDEDEGLNGGAAYVSVDLSNAPGGLTEGEESAIAWIFAGAHQVEGLTLTFEELIEEGYLSKIEFGEDASGGAEFYEWEDGLLFSITAGEWEDGEAYSLPVVKFTAEKWRTPLGAYCFFDCMASWSEMGTWSGYSVGAHMVS